MSFPSLYFWVVHFMPGMLKKHPKHDTEVFEKCTVSNLSSEVFRYITLQLILSVHVYGKGGFCCTQASQNATKQDRVNNLSQLVGSL